MGQNHSSKKSASVIFVDTFPTYEDKTGDHNINPSNQIDDSDPTFGYCCCNIKSTKKTSLDNKWKKLMVDQLEELDLETWPKQLSKYLKKYNANVDGFYQGDLVWAYKNTSVLERKSFSYQSILSHQKDESFLEKSDLLSTTERKSIIQPLDRKAANEAVQGMIEASHILDEKFYEDNNKETWMDKSFDIRPEQAQLMNESVRRLRQESQATKFAPPKKKGKRLPELYSSAAKSAEYTKKHIEKYKNNTFVNQLPAAAHEKQENEESGEDMYQTVLKYKTVTQTIDRHTKQKKNIFYQLIMKFTGYFEETYNSVLQKTRQNELTNLKLKEYSAKATVDLQQFIRIVFEGLCSYYRFDYFENGGKDLLFNRDNLINFITSLVFTGPLYSIIFEFYKLEDREAEDSFQKKLKNCKKFRPQDFGVSDEYCLNELTVKHFLANNMIPEKPSVHSPANILKGFDKPSYTHDGLPIIEEQKETYQTYQTFQESKASSEDFSETKEDELDRRYSKIIQGHQPYRDAIMALTNLKYRNSPIHKLKNIVKVAELVTKSIESFYAEFGLTSYNKLDSDQTLSIFLYIVSKSGASDILAHCKIIEKFSTINILSSVSGYYATTLEACVDCICRMKIDETPSSESIKPELQEFMRSVRWNSLGGAAGSSRDLDNKGN